MTVSGVQQRDSATRIHGSTREREGEWVPTGPSGAELIIRESSENTNLSIFLVLEIGIGCILYCNLLFYWSIIDLQCVSLWYTAKWFIYIYAYICSVFYSFSSWLTTRYCAIQWDLVVCLFYVQQYASANLKHLI